MKGILRLYYKWELNNELFACFYFTAILCMYSIEVLMQGERSIDIFIMLEMLLVSYAIAIVQTSIFSDDSNYSKKALIVRTIIWFFVAMILVFITSIIFQWFANLQTWAMGVFMVYMVLLLIALWIGIHIANKFDTKVLNNMLSHYQEKKKVI